MSNAATTNLVLLGICIVLATCAYLSNERKWFYLFTFLGVFKAVLLSVELLR